MVRRDGLGAACFFLLTCLCAFGAGEAVAQEYDLFRHSAGGQILHRIALFHPGGAASPGARARSDPPQPDHEPDASVPLGVYVACAEAPMHTETLELSRDTFFHYISTDIPPAKTTRGTYRMHGDTLVFTYEISAADRAHREFLLQQGKPAEEVDEMLLYPWRMVFDRLEGRPVLWRTPRIGGRDRGTGPIHPHALLVYAGSTRESASGDHSCGNLLRR